MLNYQRVNQKPRIAVFSQRWAHCDPLRPTEDEDSCFLHTKRWSLQCLFGRNSLGLPSGKHTKNHGTPFFLGKSTISMAMSNSKRLYKLPEGIYQMLGLFHKNDLSLR